MVKIRSKTTVDEKMYKGGHTPRLQLLQLFGLFFLKTGSQVVQASFLLSIYPKILEL